MDQCGFPGPSSLLGNTERTGTHSCLKNCPFCGTGNRHGLGFKRGGSTSEQSLPSKPCCHQSALILLWPRSEGGGFSLKPSPRIPPTSLKHIYTITSGYNLATSLPNVRELQAAAPPLLQLLCGCFSLAFCLPVTSIRTPIIGAQATQDSSSTVVCGQHLPRVQCFIRPGSLYVPSKPHSKQ